MTQVPSPTSPPLRVVVTGAVSDIGQAVSDMVARGKATGARDMELVLVEAPHRLRALREGVMVELGMCRHKHVTKYTCTDNLEEAMCRADAIFLCAGQAASQQAGFSRGENVSLNAIEYKAVGQAIERTIKRNYGEGIKPDTKILVVKDPPNSNMDVLLRFAPSLKRHNIMGLSRGYQNRAATYIARMLDISCDKVRRMTVWGNLSESIFIDVAQCEVELYGHTKPARDAIQDDFFIKHKFNSLIAERQNEIEKRRNAPLCLPVASAAVQHMADWIRGTDCSSMIVLSDGSYGIEKGLPFSFPVEVKPNGMWSIIQGINLNIFQREKLDEQQTDVTSERDLAYTVLNINQPVEGDEEQAQQKPWSFSASNPKTPCCVLRPADKLFV